MAYRTANVFPDPFGSWLKGVNYTLDLARKAQRLWLDLQANARANRATDIQEGYLDLGRSKLDLQWEKFYREGEWREQERQDRLKALELQAEAMKPPAYKGAAPGGKFQDRAPTLNPPKRPPKIQDRLPEYGGAVTPATQEPAREVAPKRRSGRRPGASLHTGSVSRAPVRRVGALQLYQTDRQEYMRRLVAATQREAARLGVPPEWLLAIFSYETAGTLNPWKRGSAVTRLGRHYGLIQWGERGAMRDYGITPDLPVEEQVRRAARYFRDRGFDVRKGHGLVNLYAAVNAGDARAIHASDARAGGRPGSVLWKVRNDMPAHLRKARQLLRMYGAAPVQVARAPAPPGARARSDRSQRSTPKQPRAQVQPIRPVMPSRSQPSAPGYVPLTPPAPSPSLAMANRLPQPTDNLLALLKGMKEYV